MLRWLALVALVAAGCVSAADAQQYNPSKDFDTLQVAGNSDPYGIWSDGTTMWVADSGDDKIYAYKMSDKSRVPSKDFDTLSGAGNNLPTGIWSDGTTMWVADSGDDKIYAYKMSDKLRVPSKDFDTLSGAGNNLPTGIWSDGTTMWVTDSDDFKIYAYKMSDKLRVPSKDFYTLSGTIHSTNGIWSDGTTIWVADPRALTIYAYKMSDNGLDNTKYIRTFISFDNTAPTGIWSDGTTMWVADSGDGKIYAYRLPVSYAAPTGPSLPLTVYVPPPDTTPPDTTPPDTTPPTVVNIVRTGNATTTDHALTWNVTFSESVVVRADVYTNYTSVANATIPDLGMVSDAMLVDAPGVVTGGSVSVDLQHPITSGLLIELVAPDCTRLVVHNQTTTFLYKLQQPHDLGDLSGVGAAGQWTLHVSDHAQYWNGTLNAWSLELKSEGAIEEDGTQYAITQYVANPGDHTLSLEGYDIRDLAGNTLDGMDPVVNEPYHVIGTAARTCHME